MSTAKKHAEIELKFLVPQASRAALAAEMARASSTLERTTLAAIYLDTADRRLARAGIAWRLRREGRRWIQTLKAAGASALERFEHEVIRPDATHDAALHAGTAVGDRLQEALREARDEGLEVGPRFQTQVRRTSRRVRTSGAVVEVAFDEGSLIAGEARARIREIEFELVSGSAAAMLALAERWRKRYGLILDPRSKAERGDRLAEGSPHPPLRKAARIAYDEDASAAEAFGVVLDECLAHVARNAIGLLEGDAQLRVEHVHQMRVGIRRLRSALASFDGWVPAPPVELVDELKALFATLGESRDSDVMDSGVVAALAEVGAPPVSFAAADAGPDPAEAVRADAAQRLFLAWIRWRASLAEAPAAEAPRAAAGPLAAAAEAHGADGADEGTGAAPANGADADSSAGAAEAASESRAATEADAEEAPSLRRRVERRLRRWHRRLVADWKVFDELDDERLHQLRKRIKRQRYAVEFYAPVLRRKKVEGYTRPLAAIQERMGELNDLFVARARYQALVASEPAAWFALGWLTARIAQVRALAGPELGRLAKVDPPGS